MIRSSGPKQLSIVIPLYNEASRLPQGLIEIQKYLSKFSGWEVVLVNDGSADATLKIAQVAAKNSRQIKVVSYKNNKGKGYALKQGVKVANKPFILISDIDFSVSLSSIDKFYQAILKGADVAIGTRKAVSSIVTKHQPRLREWLGKQFTALSNLWLGLKISDFTCGFKMFKKTVAKELFSLSKIKGWGYDAEILYLANEAKYRVVEVPVTWINDDRTRVRLVKDIFQSIKELIQIKL